MDGERFELSRSEGRMGGERFELSRREGGMDGEKFELCRWASNCHAIEPHPLTYLCLPTCNIHW